MNGQKRKLDAYRIFISEAIPGYVKFMEAINHTITKLQEDGVIGKTRLKSRIKSINSALVNTDKKALDDIFGFDIITQNERDKEILMLIIHNLFVENFIKQKNHNKSNGYFAHHCTGSVKRDLTGTEVTDLEKHILEAETKELKEQYRDLSHQEKMKLKKSEIFGKKQRYPNLRQEILDNGQIDENLRNGFENALSYINNYIGDDPVVRRNMPVMELQFKTEDVENEAKIGRAQHAKYKKVNEDEIRNRYLKRSLVRGVDFPFIFLRGEDGNICIEQSGDTIMGMWPFLEEIVVEHKRTDSHTVANYDMFLAKVFTPLEPYVKKNLENESSIPVDEYDADMAWSILKNKIINRSFVLPFCNELINIVGRN